MALALNDRVQETTNTTGTGTVTLIGAVPGYQSFAVIGNGNTTYYCIAGQGTTEWEVGIGTYTSSGTTLARTTILASSNAGAVVSFSAGTKLVFVTYPSEKSVNLDASGNANALGTPAAFTGTNITGTAASLTAGHATALATARTISGQPFDGTADISIPLANLSDVVLDTPLLNQLLGYNGVAWTNTNPPSAGAGTGVVFYNATPVISPSGTESNVAIATLTTIPVVTAEQTITGTASNNTILFSAFVSVPLNRSIIDAGVWDFTSWIGVDSAAGTNLLTRQVYTTVPFVTGTVTITGSGTSRTATASAGIPFDVSVIDASATNTIASYLQTPSGLYQITARTSDTVVTIGNVPTTYTNESAVAGTVLKKLFGITTSEITSITPSYGLYEITTTAGAYNITAATGIGILGFFTSTTNTITVTYNGTTHNTHVSTPLVNVHNDLAGLQGGASSQYYHSTAAEYTGTGSGIFVRQTSPTLTSPNLSTPTVLVATNVTGTAASLTAGTVTTNANLSGMVTSVGNTTTVVTNADLTGEAVSSGNAVTVTNAAVIAKVLTGYVSGAGTVNSTDSILQAIEKLNGNAATIPNLTGVITSVGNVTSIASQTGIGTKFVVDNSPILISPNLDIPSVLVGTNITGTAASLTAGTVTTNANLTGVISSVGNATSIVSQTGTGTKFVVDTSPTLITPNLGTPSALVGTNITGTAAGLTSGTVTTNANLTGGVTSVGNATTVITNADLTGVITSVGNATSIASQTGTGTKFVVDNSPTLITPNLGTPSVLVGTNITGVATSFTSSNVTTNANLTGGVTSVGNATTVITNANLTGVITSSGNATAIASQTGTGTKFVVDTSPTLVTPDLGTPTALVATNVTGTAASLTAGAATALATARTIAGVSFDGTADINIALDNLSDVVIVTPTVNQLLGYNGSYWINTNATTSSAGTGVVFYNATPSITAAGSGNAIPILTFANIPVTTAEQTVTGTASSDTVGFSAFVSAPLGRTVIDAGVWDFTIFTGITLTSASSATLTRQIYTALPFVTGTVTTTGFGTTRTATASAGFPFDVSNIDASATNTVASYLQTPEGIYQISVRTSDTVVTIITPTGYTNESAVAGTVWKKLFGITTPDITYIYPTIGQIDVLITQPAYPVSLTTSIGILGFVTAVGGAADIYITYNGTSRNTHVNSPLANLHNDLAGLNGGTTNQYYHSTAAEYTGTGTGVFVRASNPTLVAPALGTPSALIGTNITGTATSFTASNVTTNANLTGMVTSVGNATTVVTNANLTGDVTSLGNATTVVTNANLSGVITSVGNATTITSQTGTGSTFVVDQSPTLTTPNLGTPSVLVGTNITGTAAGLTAGTVTTNANLTGGVTSVGNAATVVTNANLTGVIESVGNATTITSKTGTGTTFVVDTSPTLITPNLGTPTTLVGTNITGTAIGFTAGTVTTNANLTGVITSSGNATSIASQTGTGSKFVVDDSPTLITPNLGTPSVLVATNVSGTASGLTAGTVTTNANLTGVITSVGNATSIASQTGTGSTFVVDTSPTLITPNLGTPSALVGTNITGTGASFTAGLVTNGVYLATTQTLTNKWIQPRFLASTANSATPTLNTDSYDMMVITGQSVAITSFTTNLTGTPVNGQKLWVSITGTGAIAITWGASFSASTIALPTTTVTTARLDVGFVWNVATTTWRCVASA
jgi:hypothetical protein